MWSEWQSMDQFAPNGTNWMIKKKMYRRKSGYGRATKGLSMACRFDDKKPIHELNRASAQHLFGRRCDCNYLERLKNDMTVLAFRRCCNMGLVVAPRRFVIMKKGSMAGVLFGNLAMRCGVSIIMHNVVEQIHTDRTGGIYYKQPHGYYRPPIGSVRTGKFQVISFHRTYLVHCKLIMGLWLCNTVAVKKYLLVHTFNDQQTSFKKYQRIDARERDFKRKHNTDYALQVRRPLTYQSMSGTHYQPDRVYRAISRAINYPSLTGSCHNWLSLVLALVTSSVSWRLSIDPKIPYLWTSVLCLMHHQAVAGFS